MAKSTSSVTGDFCNKICQQRKSKLERWAVEKRRAEKRPLPITLRATLMLGDVTPGFIGRP
jgi:hypothetical protein